MIRILTIEHRESREHWQAFWRGEDPRQMRGMRALDRCLKVEVGAEFEDHTV